MSKKILIAGGTGLIGKALSESLVDQGHHITILTRSAKKSNSNIEYVQWNPAKKTIEGELLEYDCVINLTGAGIADKRWTENRKKEILTSRTVSTAFLIESLPSVGAYIGASAVGFYGKNDNLNISETADGDESNFMSKVCIEWEKSHARIGNKVERSIIFRIGIVLANEGGALPKLIQPMKFGIGTYMGDGSMVYPWIHIDDVVSMFSYAITNENIDGVYNMVAPDPCTQKVIIDTASRLKKFGSIKMPAPAFILKTMLGEMADTVLMSSHVSATKIKKSGFSFSYPTIDSALSNLLG